MQQQKSEQIADIVHLSRSPNPQQGQVDICCLENLLGVSIVSEHS